MEWRLIDTAPKDGTWILVCGDPYDEGEVPFGVTRWVVESEEQWRFVDENTQKREVDDTSHWDDNGQYFRPTHWMPIPPQPNKL